ncbi:MAG TPA: 4Fe-4S dicluster domain-containing protein [Spirochaetia bacterium]|nr:4Fe-4S dicluster domain-containing protein [Spirochaetia bacterium]
MIVLDGSRCVGCQACVVACLQEHGRKDLVKALVIRRDYRDGRYEYRINVCRHCTDPECIPACPEGAFVVREGVVFLDVELCAGCGICVDACLYGAVSLGERAGKCNLCSHREGVPACVKTCPTGALTVESDRGGE